MILSQRRAECCNNLVYIGLSQGQEIRVSFNHIASAGLSDCSFVLRQAVKDPAFVVDRSFGRIQVLGMAIFQDTTAQSHYLSGPVKDRKDNPPAKTVIVSLPALPGDKQTRLFCLVE